MNLYELLREHGTGKGAGVMWRCVELISDYIEEHDDGEKLLCDIYGEIVGYHYDAKLADAQIKRLFYVDKEGERHNAPYWSAEQMREAYDKVKGVIPSSYTEYDFFVALNLIKSDFGALLDEWFAGDNTARVVDMAVTFINDPDAKNRDCKVWAYFNDVF